MNLATELENKRKKAEQGAWLPANGGTEQPFVTRSGRRLQYLYQSTTGKHAYIDCDTDVILTDAEASTYLGL